MNKNSNNNNIQRKPILASGDSLSALKVVVTCPVCRAEVDVGAAIQQVVEEQAGAQVAVRQAELKRQEADLAKGQAALEEQVRQLVDGERAKISEKAQAAAREELSAKLEASEAEAAETRNKLKAAQVRELELHAQRRALDDQTAELRLTFTRQLEADRTALRETFQVEAEQQQQAALSAQQAELTALRRAAQATKAKELSLLKKAEELAQAERSMDDRVHRRVQADRAKLSEQAQATAREDFAALLAAKEREAADSRAKLQAAQARELEFQAQKRKLEDDEAALDLTIEQRIGEERERIRLFATTKAKEQMDLTLREKELLMQGMRDQMETMRRKLDQGSQQAQGEAQELLLEELLRQAFPADSLKAVAKGVEGADVLHVVRDAQGRECGTILWESKRTKTWADAWVPKLHGDRAKENATIAALATQAMPKGITNIGQVDGAWVCAFSHAVPMAMLLRQGLLDTAMARKSMENQQDKMTLLYRYLNGSEFQGRVSAVVYAGNQLLNNLFDERKAMVKLWAERERLLWLAMGGMQSLQSDLQAIAGTEIQVLPPSDEGIRQLEAMAASVPPMIPMAAMPPTIGEAMVLGSEEELKGREVRFLAALTGLGGKVGNAALREALSMSEAEYEDTKQRLVLKNRINLARGRGGSICLRPLAN